jgi:DNA-binding SARP family transcriptional activator/TolB-like protein/tetratricopeptide (TPR) repeat protein
MPSLKLLGSPTLEAVDGPVGGPATQRHRLALLALLASAHPDGMSRDKLIGQLWPERDSEHGRNLLKQAVHALRRALGADAILSTGDVLRLNGRALMCDVIAFDQAIADTDFERAIDLYRGPFLDGFFLSDSPEFEQWVDVQRNRLADARAKALESLAVRAEAAQRFGQAVEWWKARALHDPYDTRVAVRLVQALAASGNRAAAIQHAARHQHLLQEELGLEPAAELAALVERLAAEPFVLPEQTAAATGGSQPVSHTEVPVATQPQRGAGPQGGWRAGAAMSAGTLGIILLIAWLLPAFGTRGRSGGESLTRAIAVLPFAYPEGSAHDSAFGRGIHTDLITALSGVRALTVISRASVMRYADGRTPLRQIGAALDIDAVLEGDVQRLGDRVRVNVQLSDARSGRVLWAEMYDRALTVPNLFAMQSEITQHIAASLEASLTAVEIERIAAAPTENITAYEFYHRARAAFDGTRAGNIETTRLLRLALDADSAFTPALAELAVAYGWRAPNLGFSTAAWDTALILARRALQIDPDYAHAHTALAAIYGHQGHITLEERAARRALELNPSDALALRRLAEAHRDRGRFADALRYHEATVRLSPAALAFRTWVGTTHAHLEDFDAAERWYRGVLSVDPVYLSALEGMAVLFLLRGQRDSATHYADRMATHHATEPRALATAAAVNHYLRNFDAAERLAGEAVQLAPGTPILAGAAAGYGTLATTMLGLALLRSGNHERADALFSESLAFLEPLIADGADSPRWPYEVALIHAAQGDSAAALDWLDVAFDRGFRWAWMLELEPALDAHRSDPRFRRLIGRVRNAMRAESVAAATLAERAIAPPLPLR